MLKALIGLGGPFSCSQLSRPAVEDGTVGSAEGWGEGVVTKEEVNTSFSFNTLINALPDKELSPSLPVSRFRNLISFILQQSLPSSPSLSPQPHKYGLLGGTQSIKTAKRQEKTTYTASSEQSTSALLRGWCLLSFMSFRGLCLCFYWRGCVNVNEK